MKRMKALVIDDEQIVLDSVRRVLTEENFDVDTTLGSRTGLGLDNDYDIVLTDIRMPDIDGMTVLLDVKAAKPSMPMVIITGYATLRSAVEAMKLGAADYIQKPFTPEQLINRVTAAIDTAAHMEDGGRRRGTGREFLGAGRTRINLDSARLLFPRSRCSRE